MSFACFWELGATSALSSPQAAIGTLPFGLFGLVFIAIGLYFTVGRFWIKAKNRRQTVYAVTDQRVLERRGRTFRSLSLAHLPSLEVTTGAKRGRIVFGSMGGQSAMYANTGLGGWFRGASGDLPMAFFDIPDAARVGRIIEDAAAAHLASS